MTGPKGLDASDEFLRYMADLRETWPALDQSNDYGRPAVPGHAVSNNEMTEQNSGSSGVQGGMNRRNFLRATAGAAALATVGVGTVAASRGSLNWGHDYVHNPFFGEDTLTKAKHKMSWGATDAALMDYEDDSGEKATLGGVVDREDTDNILTVRADKMDVPDFYVFPRGETFDSDGDGDDDEDVSALDPQHWTLTNATNGSISVEDGGLKGEYSLRASSTSVASGETVTATFDMASITSDVSKRYLQLVTNVDALASGSVVTIRVIDGDGDKKAVKIDPAGDTANDDVIASATGTGIVSQVRLGDLATTADGDGSFTEIETVEIEIADADADITLAALDVEKKSRLEFGSRLINEDTDDEERVVNYEPSGDITATGLDTFSSEFTVDGATFYDVAFPMHHTLEKGSLAFEHEFEATDEHPGYDFIFTVRGKQEVPAEIDLKHAGLTYEDEQKAPSSRYLLVRTAEAVGDTAFADIDDTEWTSHTSSYGSRGSDVALSSAVQPGVTWAYEAEILVTTDQKEAIESGTSDGGGGGAMLAEDDGPLGWAYAVAAGFVAFLMVMVGRLRGD